MEPLAAPGSLVDLAAALGELERWSATIALAVDRFDREVAFTEDGSVSMRAWLRANARMSSNAARALVRRGRLLREVPELGDAAVTGRLSAGQVDAIAVASRGAVLPVLVEQADELLPVLVPLSVADIEIACAAWRRGAETLVDANPPPMPASRVSWGEAGDGTVVGGFVLHRDQAVHVQAAVESAMEAYRVDDVRGVAERRADALAAVCAFFNANHERTGTPRRRPHVELIVDAADGAASTNGYLVDPTCVDTLTCDCVVHRVTRTGSVSVDYGRGQRSVPRDLFRAVAVRDGGCRFPGCDRPVSWTDAHHVVHWRRGGPTAIHNLCLLCSRHHHLIHRTGWAFTMAADATVEVVMPSGRRRTSLPRGPAHRATRTHAPPGSAAA